MAGIRVKATLNASRMLKDMRRVREKIMPAAAVSALNTTGQRAVRTPAVGKIASDARVPKSRVSWRYTTKGIKTKTRRLSMVKAKQPELVVSFYWRKRTTVSAISLTTRPMQNEAGVRTGGHFWPKAFIASSQGIGNRQVYKRLGRARYPIKVQAVELRAAGDRALTKYVNLSGPFFVREYDRQMSLRLRRKR